MLHATCALVVECVQHMAAAWWLKSLRTIPKAEDEGGAIKQAGI